VVASAASEVRTLNGEARDAEIEQCIACVHRYGALLVLVGCPHVHHHHHHHHHDVKGKLLVMGDVMKSVQQITGV
jgi:hypothetical protein